jgi:hypothetical protein
MCLHRRIVLLSVAFILLALSALPAAAQPARAAETAGQQWIELWQNLIAPFTVLTGDGRGVWDPNGGDSADAAPDALDTADGRGSLDPNGNPTS